MKLSPVNLDKLINDFGKIEQKLTELKGKSNIVEIKLEETNRLLRFSQSKEKCLIEERDRLLDTVSGLQQTLQQQCDLRAENDKLKIALLDMKKQTEGQREESTAEMTRLKEELKTLREHHKRELYDRDVETQRKLAAKDLELKKALDMKASVLEEMRKKISETEREKHSEILKLQMEFGAKLARAQSMKGPTQQSQGSCPLPQNVFKRKLQFIQEEKNKEIEALRQRVKELEQQALNGLASSHSKRRKI
ncbi:coiled-coil domain-containing protein 152 [Chanos chanos]|uniref:Coiled-coil domain-containing protein 152 n=1 Tax=Chanos chanos TaxID=29144 RepID=A0A6J2UTR2_CHACN|nr:coiled-coil domain-containing protein 152 [Chanos chanos]